MQGSTTVPSSPARKRGHGRSILSTAITGALLLGCLAPALAQSYVDPGQAGDASSWQDDEFNADWGLGAIGAQYAYARGLTGRGVRLGIFDSGVDLQHGDFAGKHHGSVHLADADCTNTVALNGPEACFTSDGDTVAVEYFHYTDADRAFVQYLVDLGYFYDWVPEYLESLAGFAYSTHGTHVAGTMAANRDGSGTHGVAFGADLTSARLFSNSYSDLDSLLGWGGESYAIGPDSGAVAGMYRQMAAHGVRAINHSWGLSQEPSTVEDMDGLYNAEGVAEYFATYTAPSLQDHLIQVWAAGNNYGDIAGIYATLPRWVAGLEPYWLSVANINPGGGIDDSSSICGLSKDWCVSAPGTDITSTVVGGEIDGDVVRDGDGNFVGLDITGQRPEYGYGDLTGTSMAAPHVTGALALLMERYPYLDNAQIRDILLTTATDLGEAGVDEVYGWGLVDLEKAIEGPGLLRVDTNVAMNAQAGGTKVWDGLAWDDWTNDIGGPGRLTKSGRGWLRLSGDNSFGGAIVAQGVLELDGRNALSSSLQVDGGYLVLNGSLVDTKLVVNRGAAVIDGAISGGDTLVAAAGKLSGTGSLSSTTVAGTVAPGHSIGTLTIDGDYAQLAGATYEAELGRGGVSDLLSVSGHASLDGTLKLLQDGATGRVLLGEHYSLLSAASLDGRFAAVDRSAFSPFLAFNVNYAAIGVSLDVVRGQLLAAAAQSANQRAVGAAADASAMNSAVAQSLTQLSLAQAGPALDNLSGELHASARSVLVDSNRHVRDAALARAQAGRGAFAPVAEGEAQSAAWIDVVRSGGHLDSDGNAARVDYDGNTTLLGYDYRFANGWSVGVLGGGGRSDLAAPGRASKGHVSSRHLGIYVGQSWGGFNLGAGVTHAQHDMTIERTVSVAGLAGATRADYDATSTQAFLEGGYRFTAGHWELAPYAQFAQVRVDADAFQETGGAAALHGEAADSRVDLSTLGLRFNLNLASAGQDGDALSLRGGIGRRHADGDVSAANSLAWSGGTAFTVHGAPLAQDATLVELGVGARLGERGLLELGYSGQLADEANDHGVNARFSVEF